jgi:hypothetical protein
MRLVFDCTAGLMASQMMCHNLGKAANFGVRGAGGLHFCHVSFVLSARTDISHVKRADKQNWSP